MSNIITNTGKYIKKTIPKALREQVWLYHIGSKFKSKCLITWCKNPINVFDFEIGHNKPESKGGTTEMNNLLPICSRCNKSMSNNYSIEEWNKIVTKEKSTCCWINFR